jgi:uncharacterized protein
MPVVPTTSYPGVYIQEVPSGSHTITGVSTSITAFIGRTRRGPVNIPTTVTSMAEFEQVFGGAWSLSNLPDAVSDFYLNGGQVAVIVRLYHSTSNDPKDRPPSMPPTPAVTVTEEPKPADQSQTGAGGQGQSGAGGQGQTSNQTGTGNQGQASTGSQKPSNKPVVSPTNVPASSQTTPPATVTSATNAVLTVGGLTLEARDPGTWGNNLRARIDPPDVRNDTDAQSRYNLNKADLFNLTVAEIDPRTGKPRTTEVFRNVTVKPDSPQRVDQALATGSDLVFVPGTLPQSVTPSPQPTGSNPYADDNAWPRVTNQVADDGKSLEAADFLGGPDDTFDLDKMGLYALENVDLFNLLCIPPYTSDDNVEPALIEKVAPYCEQRRAVLLLDPPTGWTTVKKVQDAMANPAESLGTDSPNAAVFFPRLRRAGTWKSYAPSGAIAGIMARTDTTRGVWKAAAGLDATIKGISGLSVPLTDNDNGLLNPLGVNCLRIIPGAGPVVWGARTLQGADVLSSDWKYTPVRRLTLFLEESLYRATRWAVFEPNDEPLWAQLRLSIGGFMHDLFRQGAFQGQTPKDAYFVQCDSTTTTQADIDRGIVNVYVGFAPVKPAEFVVLYIQPIAGQAAV